MSNSCSGRFGAAFGGAGLAPGFAGTAAPGAAGVGAVAAAVCPMGIGFDRDRPPNKRENDKKLEP